MSSDLSQKINLDDDGRPIVRFWSNRSEEDRIIEDRLRGMGYSVKGILSGSREPILEYGGQFTSGYKEIILGFL